MCECYNKSAEGSRGVPLWETSDTAAKIIHKGSLAFLNYPLYWGSKSLLYRDFYDVLESKGYSKCKGFLFAALEETMNQKEGLTLCTELLEGTYKTVLIKLVSLRMEDDFSKWNDAICIVQGLVHSKQTAAVFMKNELLSLSGLTSGVEVTSVLGNLLRYMVLNSI